jgi:magnesium chelatase family protein
MRTRQMKKYCTLTPDAHAILDVAMQRLALSARAYSRIIKLARTISDLENSADILPHHISEAIQYRSLDRGAV